MTSFSKTLIHMAGIEESTVIIEPVLEHLLALYPLVLLTWSLIKDIHFIRRYRRFELCLICTLH